MKGGRVMATGKACPGAGGLPLIRGPLPPGGVFGGGRSVSTEQLVFIGPELVFTVHFPSCINPCASLVAQW